MHQVDTSALEVGMTKSEVLQILGQPTSKRSAGSEWRYDDRRMIWCGVSVFFDEDGRYAFVFHDH